MATDQETAEQETKFLENNDDTVKTAQPTNLSPEEATAVATCCAICGCCAVICAPCIACCACLSCCCPCCCSNDDGPKF